MLPTNFIGKAVKIEMLNERDLFVQIEHNFPQQMEFEPGQFISLKVAENTFRPYSIVSDFTDKNSIAVVVSVDHEGIGSNYLKQLKVGDSVSYLGPSGLMKLKEPVASNLHFFATGTGLAPLLAIIYKLYYQKYTGNINVYFGVRCETQLFKIEELEKFKNDMTSFSYSVFCSQPKDATNYPPKRVTDVVNNLDINDSQFYLCGHPAMIEDVKNSLILKGVNLDNIIFEKFTVIQKPPIT